MLSNCSCFKITVILACYIDLHLFVLVYGANIDKNNLNKSIEICWQNVCWNKYYSCPICWLALLNFSGLLKLINLATKGDIITCNLHLAII